MVNYVLEKKKLLRSQSTNDDNKLKDTYRYINEFHLNKGRGFGIYSPNGLLLLMANEEYENFLIKLYGSDKIYIGKTLMEICHENTNPNHNALFDKVLKTGNVLYENTFKCLTYLKEDIFLDVTLIPIYGDNKRLLFIVESFSDVTEKEKQKTQIVFFEKQKEFFSYICHEFKTPLTIIISAIQTIKLICKDDLSTRSLMYLKKIHQGSLQQWRLVTQLLDILKSDSGYLKTRKKNQDIIKMTKSICNAVSVYAKTKGITLRFSSTLKELIIGIDDDKYERILLNLLSNAIKFTPCGKSVSVRVSLVEDKVKIIVKDSGIGIPKEDIKEIFQLFSRLDNSLTRKTEGTGIGLHLVKEFTNALDGHITVRSTLGKGSSFILLLPIKKVQEEMIDETCYNLTGNHLVEMANIEFSNVYFE